MTPDGQRGATAGGRASGTGATVCYMRRVTHREMRNESAEILRAVAAGETVEVTNHGQVAAIISPPNLSAYRRLVANGEVREPRRDGDAVRSIRRRTAPVSSADILADTRGHW